MPASIRRASIDGFSAEKSLTSGVADSFGSEAEDAVILLYYKDDNDADGGISTPEARCTLIASSKQKWVGSHF